MNFTFKLWDGSSNSVILLPDFNYKKETEQVADTTRSKDGSLYRFKYGDYTTFKLEVPFIDTSLASTVNSWFEVQQLCQFEISSGGGAEVNSVMFINDSSPFDGFSTPDGLYMSGKLELSTY